MNERAHEKHGSVIQSEITGEVCTNEPDWCLKSSSNALNRFCVNKVSHGDQSVFEMRIELWVPGRKGFLVDGLIQGANVTSKVDTGARRSFITEDTYYNMLPVSRPVLDRVRSKFIAVDGQIPFICNRRWLNLIKIV